MAEALVSKILEQLASLKEIEQMRSIAGTDEVQKLTENLSAIQPAELEDVEKKRVVDSRVREWLHKLQGASYDIEDVLDEWNATTRRKLQMKEVENASNLWRKVRSHMFSDKFSSTQDFFRQSIDLRMKAIIKTLNGIVMEKNDFNLKNGTRVEQLVCPVIYLPKVVGKDYDKNTIINHLLSESSQGPTLPIISIVGTLGIEKTTLAQSVVNDDKVKSHFDNDIIWVSGRKTFDEVSIAREILKYLKKDVAPGLDKLETLLGEIRQCLETKKILLVLDDMLMKIPKIWEQFKQYLGNSQESRILVTTSTIMTAKMMGTNNMVILGNEWQSSLSLFRKFEFSRKTREDQMLDVECWALFSKILFSTVTRAEHESTSRLYIKIVHACKRSPSLAKILGSLLSSKTNSKQWENVYSELLNLEEMETPFPTPLLLSYYDLPSNLKKCFLYCAVFPKDFVINKDKLIKLWIAQGYLKESGRNNIELVGEECFAILTMRHFFQDFERSVYDGSIIRCKIPYVAHEFVKRLMEKECFTVIDGGTPASECTEALHLMRVDGSICISSICNKKKLRSLVVNNAKIEGQLSLLFDHLTCLKSLDLSGCSIEEIPRNIKKLMCLRYLNLSHNEKIKELPETLCELDNLQTLDVSNCYYLEKLPLRIGNLINLRHLINHRTCLSYMPKGIESLIGLRTLTKFVVSHGKGGSLECLQNLKQLEGLVSITGLGNVSRVEEINKGKLKDNENIYGLSLRFDGWSIVDDEGVFQKFEAPPNLEELVIQRYTSETMSLDWIKKLTKLWMLKLMSCFELMELPALGKLSALESLIVCNMRTVKKVDFGIDTDASDAFSKLRYLKFWNMIEWEEWAWSRSTKSVKIMPCLRYLVLDSCPKLKSLSLLGELPSLESILIKGMLSVTRAGDEFLGTSSSSSSYYSTVSTFPKLINLEFEDMEEWEEWSVKWDGRVMPNLLSLKFHSCPKLVALPNNLLQRPALQKLIIADCLILHKNYNKKTGKNWSRISHIPSIQIHSPDVHENLSSGPTPPPNSEHPSARQDNLLKRLFPSGSNH